MIIIPSTELRLMRGIPFNNDYNDTIWFTSPQQQHQFMLEHLAQGQSFTDFTYLDEYRGISVGSNISQIYDCNYCMFRNDNYENKWFYAFITGMVYINNGCTAISIEIDYIQTWLFDFHIGKSFVEREHVSDDTIGKHTIPENIPFGDLVAMANRQSILQPVAVLRYAESSNGSISNNVYDPLDSIVSSNASAFNAKISELAETPEKIAMLKMGVNVTNTTLSMTRAAVNFTFNGDTYEPINKKLFTYPYTCLTVDDFSDNVNTYKWEDFENPLSATFDVKGGYEPYPYMALIPNSYKGMGSATNYMTVKVDFPDCPYIIDNFRAWLSSVGAKQANSMDNMVYQNTVTDITQIISALNAGVSAGASAATGNVQSIFSGGGALTGSVVNNYISRKSRESTIETQKANNAVDMSYAKTHGTSIGGQFGGSNVPWFMGLIGWRVISQGIKPEYARTIDEYFTRFGYKVNEYKIPETNSRSSFNYVKTVKCVITGNIPSYVGATISRIFDSGITLWHNANIGMFENNYIVEKNG